MQGAHTKTFEEFLKALETDEALKAKVKNALETAEAKTEEAKISVLTKLAAENGYNVSTEDFAKHQASCQELDEDELKLATGGSREPCWFDYVCGLVWNSCVVSDESICTTLQTNCTNNLGNSGWG